MRAILNAIAMWLHPKEFELLLELIEATRQGICKWKHGRTPSVLETTYNGYEFRLVDVGTCGCYMYLDVYPVAGHKQVMSQPINFSLRPLRNALRRVIKQAKKDKELSIQEKFYEDMGI